MSEFELQINQGSITVNLDDLKAELKEISDKYKGIVIKENDISLAKKDLARLRKIRKSVDDRRKEVKAEWNKPYVKFEDEVKNALAIIDAPINEIDSILKDFDTQQKAEKEQHIRELYQKEVADKGYEEYLPFGNIFDDKWLNKSCTDKEIIFELNGKVTQIKMDMDAIKALNSEFEDEVIKAYKKNGNQLSIAIQRNTELLSAKQIAEQKVKEEIKETPKEEPVKEPEINPLPFDVSDYAIFTVKAKDEEQAQKIQEFLDFSEINYSVVY